MLQFRKFEEIKTRLMTPKEVVPGEVVGVDLLPVDLFEELTRQSEQTITAMVLADSINPNGQRLTTMEWTYPRFIHSEIMTHRQLSRNSASSRAIPLPKMIERLYNNPVFPLNWGKNQKGMQSSQEDLPPIRQREFGYQWLTSRDNALRAMLVAEEIGVHKQIGNRIGETWMWITIICSCTNWENLFALRCHPMAEPHFQNLAYKARNAYDASKPRKLEWGQWHLPLHKPEEDGDVPEADLPKICAGRCARVSYLTHHGTRDTAEDIRLCKDLAENKPMHASPLEHVAQATNPANHPVDKDWGNFDPGWFQLRKMLKGECVRERVEI